MFNPLELKGVTPIIPEFHNLATYCNGPHLADLKPEYRAEALDNYKAQMDEDREPDEDEALIYVPLSAVKDYSHITSTTTDTLELHETIDYVLNPNEKYNRFACLWYGANWRGSTAFVLRDSAVETLTFDFDVCIDYLAHTLNHKVHALHIDNEGTFTEMQNFLESLVSPTFIGGK